MLLRFLLTDRRLYNKLIIFATLLKLLIIISVSNNQQVVVVVFARPQAIVTNKMRYGSSETTPVSVLNEQAFEYAASNIDRSFVNLSPYKVISNNQPRHEHDKFHRGKLLDEEDERLLEKFYRETKQNDPFFNSVWEDREGADQFKALLDNDEHNQEGAEKHTHGKHNLPGSGYDYDGHLNNDPNKTVIVHNEHRPQLNNHNNDWTIDTDYNLNHHGFQVPFVDDDHLDQQAKYSPTFKLLTSYNPIKDFDLNNNNNLDGILSATPLENPGEGRIIGATLIGHDQNQRPSVSSKSALEAIKFHDDLLKTPPKDGKVRVRMYHHRAIHDDARLYGNGPWKYWGHGWGLEFGFDPKVQKKGDDGDKSFYQKGYTIERAFGRDFCKDKLNCRHPDPEFFNDPKNVGKYSRQFNYSKKRFSKEPKLYNARKSMRNTVYE